MKATASACIDAGYHQITEADGPILVTYIACPSRAHLWDDEGLVGGMKAARDTIARALGVDDVRFQLQPVERGDKTSTASVIVRIEVAR